MNTLPLVWGMLHGPQRGVFDLSFAIPSVCADRLERREVDIGIVPAVELNRLPLEIIPGTGIACHGAVRSILLISKWPVREIRKLAVDRSSRTSVALARIVLEERYGVQPELISHEPDLERMLAVADAALIIGDPALRIEPDSLPYAVLDLGEEWLALTGLPMVFAVWAGWPDRIRQSAAGVFLESYRYGRTRLDEILEQETESRGISKELGREYLTRHIISELGPQEYEGLRLFRDYARRHEVFLAEK